MSFTFGPFSSVSKHRSSVCSPFTRYRYAPFDPGSELLIRRCVPCPQEAPPCPICAENEICAEFSGSCDSCPTVRCVPENGVIATASSDTTASSGTSSTSAPNSSSSPYKPKETAITIVEGVLGGIVAFAVIGGLIYLLSAKRRNQKREVISKKGSAGRR